MRGIATLVVVELRSGVRRVAALAVLVGVLGGVALGAVAGARRTETSFTRMLGHYPGPDVIIPNVPDPSGRTAVFDAATVRAIPGVRVVAGSEPLVTIIHGQPTLSVAHVDPGLGGPGLLPYKIVDGRQVDPTRLDEAIANFVGAQRLHLHVGDILPLRLVPPFDEMLERPGVHLPSTVRVVGEYVGPSEIFSEEQTIPALHFSAAFARLFPPFVSPGLLVALRDGPGGVPAFIAELERRANGKRVEVDQAHAADRDKQLAIRIEADAVWLLAGLLAITALLILAQASLRQAWTQADDNHTLAALGMTPGELWLKAMLRAGAVLLVGAAVAVGVMYLVSPLLPVGIARLAEPHPGFAFDAMVAEGGALALILAVLAATSIPLWILTTRSARGARGRGSPGHGAPAGAPLRGRRLVPTPLSMSLGAALAFDRRRGPNSVPVAATVGSIAVAIAGLTTALVFAASLTHLLGTPRTYGLTWDATLGSASTDARSASASLAADPRVRGLAFGVTAVAFQVGAHDVDAELIDPSVKGSSGPVVLEGRAPARPGEIALGTRTMRDLGLHIGSQVQAGPSGGRSTLQRVVGRVVLEPASTAPQAGFVNAAELRLGDGALTTYSAVAATDPGATPPAQAFVRLTAGLNSAEALPALASKVSPDAAAIPFASPRDIVAFGRVGNLPLVLAGLLAVVAVTTLVHMLLVAIRRRRRDVAVLKVLGLERRGVLGVVVWQAVLLVLAATLFGAVVGVAAGRWLWSAVLSGAGIVADPRISVLTLVGVGVGAPLVAAAIAIGPGSAAARVRPGIVLRTA